jgi:hypothetical protein
MPELISIKIRQDQRDFLEKLSSENGTSICAIVRDSIDMAMARKVAMV